MCLDISTSYKKDLENFKKDKGNYVRFYKIFRISNGNGKKTLITPYRGEGYMPLVNISNREKVLKGEIESPNSLSLIEKSRYSISYGIHVFIEKKDAYKEIGYLNTKNKYVVVPVYCKAKNIIAIGKFFDKDSAVCTEITIQKRDYERALKKGKK